MFRRRSVPPDLSRMQTAFGAVLDELEPAKAAITDVMPGTRMPGRPLSDALDEFERRLARADELMGAWRGPQLEDAWSACAEGLRTSLALARRLREGGSGAESFEGLLGLVQALVDPLEPFARAESVLRSLRRR
jgi:hypothetical protein